MATWKPSLIPDPVRPSQLQLGVFRSFGFDYAVIVLLSAVDYSVVRASKVPRHVMIESAGKHREHEQLTGQENLRLVGRLAQLRPKLIPARADELLERLGSATPRTSR